MGNLPSIDELSLTPPSQAGSQLPKFEDLSFEPPRPSVIQLNALRKAFSGDPMNMFEEDEKAELRPVLMRMTDPDRELKKHVLASYYSKMNRRETEFVFNNLDSVIEHFHGTKLSVDQAYNEVSAILNGPVMSGLGRDQSDLTADPGFAKGYAAASKKSVPFSMLKNLLLSAGKVGLGNITAWGLFEPVEYERTDWLSRIPGETVLSEAHPFDLGSPEGRRVIELSWEKRFREENATLPLVPFVEKEENAVRIAEIDRQIEYLKRFNKLKSELKVETTPGEYRRQYWKLTNDMLESAMAENSQAYRSGKGLAETFKEDGFASGAKELGALAFDQLGNLGMQTANYILGGEWFAFQQIAQTSVGQRLLQLEEAGIEGEDKYLNALIYGAAEAIPEKFLGSIKYFRMIEEAGMPGVKLFVKGFRGRAFSLMKSMGGAAVSETSDELITFISEKFADGFLGVDQNGQKIKKFSEMTKSEISDYMRSGLLETVAVAGIMGAGFGGIANIRGQTRASPEAMPRRVNCAEIEKVRNQARQMLESEKASLLEKEDLTDEEADKLRTVETALESNDMDKVISTAKQLAVHEYLSNPEGQSKERNEPLGESLASEEKQRLENSEDEMTGEQIAMKALRDYKLDEQFNHHPDDTVNAVNDLRTAFPGMKTLAVTDVSQLPESVRLQAEAEGYDISRILAFPHGDTVYVNALQVKPHDVPRLVLQEWVGHVGIREAFNGRLDPLLDRIASTRAYQPEIAKFAEQYSYDLTTVEGRRKATAEFLAHGGERDIKPSRWKELLFHIKQFLRKIPGLSNMRLTDRELEGVLSKAYRHMMDGKNAFEYDNVNFSLGAKETLWDNLNDKSLKPSDIIKAPDGKDYWGEITPDIAGEAGIDAGKVILSYGKHYGTHKGFGLEHIKAEHFEDYRKFNLDPERFISYTLSGFNEIWRGNDGKIILVKHGRPKGIGVIELRLENGVYSIDSVYPVIDKRIAGKKRWIRASAARSATIGKQLAESPVPLSDVSRLQSPLDEHGESLNPDNILSQSPEKSSTEPESSFSLAPRYSDRQMDNMAKFLWPTVEKMKGDLPSKETAFRILKDAGFKVYNEGDAWTAVIRSRELIRKRNRRAAKAARDKWRANEYPILTELQKTYGENVKIKPSTAFKGEYDSDFIISRKGKNTVLSDEAAKKLGVAEDELFAEIGKLKGVDMEKAYQDYRQHKTGRRGKITKMRRELQEQGNFFGAYEIVHGDQPLNDWIIKNNPKVAEEVYMQVMGEPVPEGKTPDWDLVRAKLAEEKASQPAQLAKGGKADVEGGPRMGEGVSYEKFKRMQIAMERALDEKTSLQDAQKAATDMAMEIPVEKRGGFLHRISGLSRFTDTPTPAYPEGRRAVELEKLLDDMSEFSREIAKSAIIERIDAILDKSNLRRVGKGRVVSLYADAQKELDNIRNIRRMSPDAVINGIEYYQQLIDKKINDGEDASFEQTRASMLESFGMLEEKSPEQLSKVYQQLNQLAKHGRNQLKEFIERRRFELEFQRDEVIRVVTGGKGLMKPQAADIEAQKIKSRFEEAGMKYYVDALNLQDMLHWITSNVPEDFRKTSLFKFIEKCHVSEKAAAAGRNKRIEAALSAFDETFGTKTPYQRTEKCQELKTKIEKTGVFRNQRDLNDQLKGIKFDEMTAADARRMLAKYDETKTGLTDYQAEAVRMKLGDIDQRLRDEFPVNRIDDGIADDVLKALQDENKKDVVLIPTIENPGESIEQPLTQMEALYMKLCWNQPTMRYKMAFNGWNEESIRQLDKFIKPEVMKFGEWMVADLANDLPNISAVYENMYMTAINGLPNYFPADFKGAAAKDIGNIYSGEMSVTPGMLTARKAHYAEPLLSDALDIYSQHVLRAEHFKSHAETARDLIAFFKNKKVRTAIEQYYGRKLYDGITERIGYFVNGGNKAAQIVPFFSKMQSTWAFMKLAWNTVSGIKQKVGGIAYINEIPVKAWLEGKMEFWRNPVENARMLAGTPYFKGRWGGAIERDVAQMFSRGKFSISKMEALFKGASEKAMIPIRLGDALAVIEDGFAVYKYHYDNLIKEGVSTPEAHKKALLRWEMATESTQQSGQTHMMNAWQMGGSLTRLLTTFKSNPILQGNAFIKAAHDAYKGKPGSWKQVAKTHFTAFVVGGMAMELIAQAWRHGVNWDEYELKRMLYAGVIGPFGSITAIDVLGDALVRVICKLENYGTESNIPFINDIIRSVHSGVKLVSGDFDEDDIYRIIESVIGGMGYMPIVGPPAKQTTSVMRELRRYYNLIFGEEENNRKHKKATL